MTHSRPQVAALDLHPPGTDGAAVLYHPPRGDAWWTWGAAQNRAVIAAAKRLWVERPDRWTVYAFDAVRLDRDGERAIATDRRGSTLDLTDGVVRAERRGLDLALARTPVGWRAANGVFDIPFFDAEPWSSGIGAIGIAAGVVYRYGRDVRAVGHGRKVRTGPCGAFVTVRRGVCTSAARPGRSATPLPVPVRDDLWLRWSEDGNVLSGVSTDGTGVRIDLTDHRIERFDRALPVDTEARLHDHGDLVFADRSVRRGLREASCAFSAPLLAGPGGVVWDLRDRRRCFSEPTVEFGATVATDGAWVTAQWSSGRGRRFEPRTGAFLGAFQLPLEPDETVEAGVAVDGRAVLLTSEERAFAVEETVECADVPELDDAPPLDPRIASLGLPLEGSAAVDGTVFGWSADGVLLSVPADYNARE